jgi:hypothetical protein
MVRVLALKELRETGWVWLLAAAALIVLALDAMRMPLLPGVVSILISQSYRSGGAEIPFVGGQIAVNFGFGMGLFGIVLGLRQTFGELRGGTFPLTLHLPMSRRSLFAVKLVTGIALIWGLGGIALATVCWWAATPGTHASPFEWSMTADSWRTWFAMPIVYLGAFTTGISPARWFGTRLFPLVTACLGTMLILIAAGLADVSPLAFVIAVVGTVGAYLTILDHLVAVRDFS